MDSSTDFAPSDHMIDYCAPSIRAERPKAPARRLPKEPRTKRRGTIEFMASFLMLKNKSLSTEPDRSPSLPLRKSPSRKRSVDVKPTCPNRRGTMEFIWSSLRHVSIDNVNIISEDSGETAMSSSKEWDLKDEQEQTTSDF